MQLRDYIKVYENAVPKEFCENVIRLVERKPEVMDHYTNTNYDFNQTWVAEILPSLSVAFAGVVARYAEIYFEELGVSKHIGIQGFEDVRVKKYIAKDHQEFREHIDASGLDSMKRYLVAILYLNDNDGYTVFPQLNLSITPKTGSLVLFPPLWLFPHAGLPPTTNDKYIMMTYLKYAVNEMRDDENAKQLSTVWPK